MGAVPEVTLGGRGRRPMPLLLAALVAAICGGASMSGLLGHPAPGSSLAAHAAATMVARAQTTAGVPAATPISSPRLDRPVPTAPVSSPDTGASTTLDAALVLLGSATVVYEVGPENGDGANIELPLRHLDRLAIEPGATFDFWTAVGEVSRRTGYRDGAIIAGHRIDPDGALAGGICTVSTALFDAAARAGLQITARTSHGGYLAKYPLGLDAAVAKGPGFRQTMAFRNDTSERIIVRTDSTPGIARVDLYAAAPLDRRVDFSPPAIRDRRPAPDRHIRTASLARGQHRRLEAPSDGMTVAVIRTVRDASGHLVHRDRWVSVYRWLDGVVLDGTG